MKSLFKYSLIFHGLDRLANTCDPVDLWKFTDLYFDKVVGSHQNLLDILFIPSSCPTDAPCNADNNSSICSFCAVAERKVHDL